MLVRSPGCRSAYNILLSGSPLPDSDQRDLPPAPDPVCEHTDLRVLDSIQSCLVLTDTCPAMMKVLIVDDNSAVRHLLRRIVGEWAEVFECEDGSQALSCYERVRPDWVLMDIRMPGVSGFEATRRIIAAHADARVVIVTEFADESMRESARQAGACEYVLKEDLTVLSEILSPPPSTR